MPRRDGAAFTHEHEAGSTAALSKISGRLFRSPAAQRPAGPVSFTLAPPLQFAGPPVSGAKASSTLPAAPPNNP